MRALLIVLLCASLCANAVLVTRRLSIAPSSDNKGAAAAVVGLDTAATSAVAADSSSSEGDELMEVIKNPGSGGVERLRKLGFSDKTIRALMLELIETKYRAREREIQQKVAAVPYWSRYYGWGGPELNRQRSALAREKRGELQSLLGPLAVDPDLATNPRFQYLSPEKAMRVSQLEADTNELQFEIRGYGMGILTAEEREKLALVEREKRAELEQILSPEERFEYALRNSRGAEEMRRELFAFEPTEAEFREIFKMASRLDPEITGGNNFDYSRDQLDRQQKARKELQEQLKTSLSPERYSEYTRANDVDYKRLYNLSSKLQLPSDTAAVAYKLKQAVEDRQRSLMKDPALAEPEKKVAALDALASDTEAQLKDLLGDEAFDAYKKSSGSFINRLRAARAAIKKP